MKVNLNVPFKNFEGNELKNGGKTVIVSSEICKILFGLGTSSGAPLSADEKYMAYKLSNRISSAEGEVDLSAEEAAFIIRICGELMTVGAYGQVRDLIENNN